MNNPLHNVSISSSEPNTPARSEELFDFGALFATIWRSKLYILACMVIFGLIGAIYAYKVPTPMYSSSATVILNMRQESVVDLQDVVGGLGSDSGTINSEVEVLKSRSLLGKVVDDLDLTSDPEFNPQLRVPGQFEQWRASLRGGVASLFGQGGNEGGADGAQMSPEAEERAIRERAVNILLSKIGITNLPRTYVFRISATTMDPEKSALIVDTLADNYVYNQVEVKFEASEQATAWLTERVSELQEELQTAEGRVTDFSANTDLISQETLIALERQAKELRDRVTSMEESLVATRARHENMAAATTPEEKVAAAQNDLQLQRMLPRLDNTEVEATFDARFATLQAQAQADIARAESQLQALRTSLQEMETRRDQQSADLITLQQLTREAEATRMLYEYFLSRLKETSAQQGIQQADSRVLSEAIIRRGPTAPNKTRIVMISTLIGFVVGLALVLIREARSNTFRTATALEARTHHTVMGQLPLIPQRGRKSVLKYLAEKPTSAAAEAIRNLRTSLMLSNIDQPPQVIMTTSSLPGEGKSTISMAMALNFSQMGKKTLLIEGDLRRRVFREYMEFDRTPESDQNFISVLTGETTLEKAVTHSSAVGADILLASDTKINAADLYSSAKYGEFLTEARRHYDQIIIDSPPVLVIPDARIIAQQVDAILFIVQWDKTLKPQVDDALDMFRSVNKPVSGIVLNQINYKRLQSHGYHSGYLYGSKYYNS